MTPTPKLSRAIDDLENRIRRLAYDTEDDSASRTLREAAECIAIVRRMLSGMELRRAFGAPGDWGYGTPIGEGLCEFLNIPR